jgi:hypothetical protein
VTPPDTDGLTGRLLTMMGIGGTVTGEIATVVDWGIRGTLSYLQRGF